MASSSALTLDDLAPPPTAANIPPIIDDHLFYPDAVPTTEPPTPDQRTLLKDRLYVGNLHPSVDEYTLLQVFSKFGKVTKLDWLFHKTGLLKGRPRGYAFVEYATAADAMNALATAHGRPLRGRKLVVTFAHQAPLDQHGAAPRARKQVTDAGRPTALSMLKTGRGHEGRTTDKIAVLEAKLRQMADAAPMPGERSAPSSAGATPTLSPHDDTGAPGPASLPTHPSLPAKPPPQIAGAPAPVAERPPPLLPPPFPRGKRPAAAGASIFPAAQAQAKAASTAAFGGGLGGGVGSGLGGALGGGGAHRAKPRLAGVRIKKEKGKGPAENAPA